MGKESEARGIVASVKDGFSYGQFTQEFYGRLLTSAGISKKDLDAFLTPQLLDEVGAFFAENLLYGRLVSDDSFRLALDDILHQTKMSQLPKKIQRGNSKKKDAISILELLKEGHYWQVLLNGEKLIKVREKRGSKYWNHIYNIAKEKESYAGDKDKCKGVSGWFNYNEENPIYKKTTYKKTNLIRYESDCLYAGDGIIIKELSQHRLKMFQV